jgi:hypothetical protein
MDRLNQRRAKQGGSARIRIEFAMLNSQCHTAQEWRPAAARRGVRSQARRHPPLPPRGGRW